MTEPISITNSMRSSISEEIPIDIINLNYNNSTTINSDQYLYLEDINDTVAIEKCKIGILICVLITSIVFILIAWSQHNINIY
jgi:hypothetical protein